jgi:hypothetical protein
MALLRNWGRVLWSMGKPQVLQGEVRSTVLRTGESREQEQGEALVVGSRTVRGYPLACSSSYPSKSWWLSGCLGFGAERGAWLSPMLPGTQSSVISHKLAPTAHVESLLLPWHPHQIPFDPNTSSDWTLGRRMRDLGALGRPLTANSSRKDNNPFVEHPIQRQRTGAS